MTGDVMAPETLGQKIEAITAEGGDEDYWEGWNELKAKVLAILTAPSPSEHKRGETHRYRITCEVCGESGTIRLTVDPECWVP